MPFPRHFIRSPSPDHRQQATITASLYTRTRLGFQVPRPRPGPRPLALAERRIARGEPAGTRHMVGGVNEAIVLEMFRSYRSDFRKQLGIDGDDNNTAANRRCAYTREHKLAAIDYTLNTWERGVTGVLEHISRYFAAKQLKIDHTLLGRWIKNKQKILHQKRGARRLVLSRVGREPEMEKKLNMDFEVARSIGRQITHRWFNR